MSSQNFIRWMIQTLTSDMDKLSADIATQALGHDSYLIGVGKYRQMKSMVAVLKERLASTDSLPEIDEDPEPVKRLPDVQVTPKKTSKPRPWGGGR